jgi:hypothetical protein
MCSIISGYRRWSITIIEAHQLSALSFRDSLNTTPTWSDSVIERLSQLQTSDIYREHLICGLCSPLTKIERYRFDISSARRVRTTPTLTLKMTPVMELQVSISCSFFLVEQPPEKLTIRLRTLALVLKIVHGPRSPAYKPGFPGSLHQKASGERASSCAFVLRKHIGRAYAGLGSALLCATKSKTRIIHWHEYLHFWSTRRR